MKEDKLSASNVPVAVWLLGGVLMIIVQVLLGGITRLTGSGLSITEWKPLLGALPPLNEHDWQAAFSGYQKIAQFKKLNYNFTLADFQFIYFWEWFHRLWARLLGVVFLVPFVIFLIQGRFKKEMIKPLVILFLLGGLQGLIGWLMVSTGLNDQNLYVTHFSQAIHFLSAMILLVYTFWFALDLLIDEKSLLSDKKLFNFTIGIIALLVIQLIYGAFMAGLKAAPFAATWPDINGAIIPSNMGDFNGRHLSFFSALVNNPITVHFIHRGLAYVIFILILIWTFKARSIDKLGFFSKIIWLPLGIVLLQVFLGIMTVLNSYKAIPQGWGVFEWYAQLHQLVAMFLLMALVLVVKVLSTKQNIAIK